MLLIKNVLIYGNERCDIFISEDGLISEIGVNLNIEDLEDRSIDGDNLIALPGFVDLHTHIRSTSINTESDLNIRGVSKSALKGGYTTIFTMPNNIYVSDNIESIENIINASKLLNLCKIHPVGAVTMSSAGTTLSPMYSMYNAYNMRLFSDDGHSVYNSKVMYEALSCVKDVGGTLMQHAQDMLLTENSVINEGKVSFELGINGWPSVAEDIIIIRDALLAGYIDSKIHICHVSTKSAVDLIRYAKSKNLPISAEATPHHLYFNEDYLLNGNTVFKVNPPLRTKEDSQALYNGVLDGTIDLIATDHAPHTQSSKETDLISASFGIAGIEFAFAVIKKIFVDNNEMTYKELSNKMTVVPGKVAGLTENDICYEIKPGAKADIVLINANKNTYDSQFSYSYNTPYINSELSGFIEYVIVDGQIKLSSGVIL